MLEAYPWMKTWSDEELDRSLAQTMSKHPEGADVWVFAYGSLIWNPTFAFAERRIAHIRGYHRRFCLRADMGRGTPGVSGPVPGAGPGRAVRWSCVPNPRRPG